MLVLADLATFKTMMQAVSEDLAAALKRESALKAELDAAHRYLTSCPRYSFGLTSRRLIIVHCVATPFYLPVLTVMHSETCRRVLRTLTDCNKNCGRQKPKLPRWTWCTGTLYSGVMYHHVNCVPSKERVCLCCAKPALSSRACRKNTKNKRNSIV